MDMFVWVIQRGREPSTYAGLGVLLATFGIPDASSWAHNVVLAATGFCGLIAMALKEFGKK